MGSVLVAFFIYGRVKSKGKCLDNLHVLSGYSCPFKTPPERDYAVLLNKHKGGIMLFRSTNNKY